jgi:hypothetical protein
VWCDVLTASDSYEIPVSNNIIQRTEPFPVSFGTNTGKLSNTCIPFLLTTHVCFK